MSPPSLVRTFLAPAARRHGLVALVVAAAWLRLAHLDFGLPAQHHPDETQATLQIQRWCRGEYALGSYRHPPLLRNVGFLGVAATRAVAPGLTGEPVTSAFVTLALRLTSALFGTLAVPALYLLARELGGRRAAFAAAVLLAVLPLHVVSSKYGVPDAMLSFWVLVDLWLCLRLARRPSSSALYFALGLGLACGFGTKYSAGVLLVPFVLAHLRAVRRAGGGVRALVQPRTAIPFAAGAATGLALSFPFALGESDAIVRSLLFEGGHLFVHGHEGFRLGGRAGYYVFHFVHSLPPTTGPVLLAWMVAGLVWLVARSLRARLRGRPDEVLLLSFVVPYYVAMEQAYKVPPNFGRYVLPLVGPYLLAAVLLGQALAATYRRALGRFTSSKALSAALFTLVLGAYPAYRTGRVLEGMGPQADTRTQMGVWMAANLPAGTRVVAPLVPAYYPDPGRHVFVTPSSAEAAERLSGFTGGPTPMSYDYVLASSMVYDRCFDFPEVAPAFRRFYERLFAEGEIVVVFEDPEASYLFQNPTIALYRLRRGRGQQR